ncbi:MAG: hypothetical protein LBG64_00365 [Pseudomonadales bacterium]|jgi:hypothetical protein|nr:hypothetical protein [Pseudomonadales bacterium]
MSRQGFVVLGFSSLNKDNRTAYWSPGLEQAMFFLDRELGPNFTFHGVINMADITGKNRRDEVNPNDLGVKIPSNQVIHELTYDFREIHKGPRSAEGKIQHRNGDYVRPTVVIYTNDGRSVPDKNKDYWILPNSDDYMDTHKTLSIFVDKYRNPFQQAA